MDETLEYSSMPIFPFRFLITMVVAVMFAYPVGFIISGRDIMGFILAYPACLAILVGIMWYTQSSYILNPLSNQLIIKQRNSVTTINLNEITSVKYNPIDIGYGGISRNSFNLTLTRASGTTSLKFSDNPFMNKNGREAYYQFLEAIQGKIGEAKLVNELTGETGHKVTTPDRGPFTVLPTIQVILGLLVIFFLVFAVIYLVILSPQAPTSNIGVNTCKSTAIFDGTANRLLSQQNTTISYAVNGQTNSSIYKNTCEGTSRGYSMVREYFCQKNQLGTQLISCPANYTCLDGACVKG